MKKEINQVVPKFKRGDYVIYYFYNNIVNIYLIEDVHFNYSYHGYEVDLSGKITKRSLFYLGISYIDNNFELFTPFKKRVDIILKED